MLSPKGNFIEQYDDIISVDECNAIRSLFQQDHRCHVGRVGKEGRIDKSVKDSMDLTVKFDDKEEEYNIYMYLYLHVLISFFFCLQNLPGRFLGSPTGVSPLEGPHLQVG